MKLFEATETAWSEWQVRRDGIGRLAPVEAKALKTKDLLAELGRRAGARRSR